VLVADEADKKDELMKLMDLKTGRRWGGGGVGNSKMNELKVERKSDLKETTAR